MTVFLQNNGRPDLPLERRRPFPLPAARITIPVGERQAITDDVLRHHGYAEGDESARSFAVFVAGIYNGNREPTWLDVIEDADAPTAPSDDTQTESEGDDEKRPRRRQPKQSTSAGDPGQGDHE